MKDDFNKFIENTVSNCDSVSVDDFFDMDDEIIETREIPEEEVPEDIREYEKLLRDAKPWDAPFDIPFFDDTNGIHGILDKMYGSIKRIIGGIFNICRKYPLTTAIIYMTANIYYAWLMVFAFIKCFGSEKAKAKASGKALVTMTVIAGTVVNVLPIIAGYIESKQALKSKIYSK